MYIRNGNKRYKLDLWDTTGQEHYDRLRPLSYAQSDVSIVCVTIGEREEYEAARDKWAPELNRICAGNPIILLGIRQPDGDDGAGLGEKTGLGDYFKYGQDIAKDIGAVAYLECDLLIQQGLNEALGQVCHIIPNPG